MEIFFLLKLAANSFKHDLFEDFGNFKAFDTVKPKIRAIKWQKAAKTCFAG